MSTDRPRIVIVEDDVSLLAALTFSLEADGYAVTPYSRAAPLLDHMPAADCMVIDLKLPDLDGLRLIARLRERGLTAPAILITTNPDDRRRRAAAEAGVEIVEKPLMDGDLRRRIEDALRSATRFS